jgi:phage tail sheath protein FI
MPQYLAPGVYVEEVPPLARPIAGVGTSTAGFIGVVPDNIEMPFRPGRPLDPQNTVPADFFTVADAGVAIQVTGWEEFKNKFGDIKAGNKRLALAVFGFFHNGGTACWIVRRNAASDLDDIADDLALFEPIDDISIVAAPGLTTKVQQDALIDHCEKMLDRVCVLDGNPSDSAPLTANDLKGGTAALPTTNSSFAALYYPWLEVFDPVTQAVIPQPPSGHVAGLYARTDATRGVFKAPANEGLLGAVGVVRQLSRSQQGLVNPAGINLIRMFDGNVRVFGARTLGGDANGEFRYISTRRYFNFLRESIDEGTQFVVFEPNSPSLWQRIIRSVGDFLLNQYNDGALFGETAKQAFFVKCDAETNPSEVREAGMVVTEIGVAIVKPAEFVIFRIQQITGS